MSNITWDNSIRQFIQQAGSASPTPGGGSVAALVAALGAAMTAMVGRLSQGEKYAAVKPQLDDVIGNMESITAACEQLLHADIAAFDRYMDALKLPKGTSEEKHTRNRAIQEAAAHAIDVPLRLLEVCKAGIACTHRIAESSNPNVISDLGIGAVLFEAAAQSAALTVEINLASLKDAELKRQHAAKLSALIRDIEELKGNTWDTVRSRIAK